MKAALDALGTRRVLLFGGKGGVGKTTVAAAFAERFSATRRTILLRVEDLDTDALYRRFLDANLAHFLEIGDRGTYLDREELRRFFELSLPGADELMAWMHIGQVAEENADAMVIVDTAPTGHALRMLAAAEHFRQFAAALDAMEEKHRSMIRQFMRRDVRDAVDEFITDFETTARRRREMLRDPAQTAFIPVLLSEPWVIEQTIRLIAEVREEGIDVPLAILNRATGSEADEEAKSRLDIPVHDFPLLARPQRGGGQDEVAAPTTLHLPPAKMLFLAGKGGTGKTTSAASIALQLAQQNPGRRYTIISVDPAHALRDVFATETPPPNLAVEMIDTRAKWRRFRETLGVEIENAIAALTPKGMSLAYDTEALQKLIEIAPPGADELFAIIRLAQLAQDETQERVIVDTAPTGHFLRLVDLPKTAGEWVREFIRILLRYRDLIPPASLGSELVNASRSLAALDEMLRSDRAAVFVVTRLEPAVIAETKRLIDELGARQMRIAGVIANYLTADSDRGLLAGLPGEPLLIERRERPVTALADLARLFDIASDSASR